MCDTNTSRPPKENQRLSSGLSQSDHGGRRSVYIIDSPPSDRSPNFYLVPAAHRKKHPTQSSETSVKHKLNSRRCCRGVSFKVYREASSDVLTVVSVIDEISTKPSKTGQKRQPLLDLIQ